MHVENAETPFSRRIKRSVRLMFTLLTLRLQYQIVDNLWLYKTIQNARNYICKGCRKNISRTGLLSGQKTISINYGFIY